MEASTSSRPHLPATPSHDTFMASASPSNQNEPTPAPLHTLPPHLLAQSAHHSPVNVNQTPTRMMPPPQTVGTPTPSQRGQGQRTFHSVMGSGPGQLPPSPASNNARVYASVYSGIPVYEAMIRGISVMRRTSDSWVNATQILKVAGIPKSARTKILDKEVAAGVHEKVQGGYGKYQGTWVPFERGQDLAAQYGVTAYLAPILDYQSSPEALPALPVTRPESRQGTTMATGYNPAFSNGQNGMEQGRMGPPFSTGPLHGQHPHQHAHQPPPQWNGEHMMYPPPHPQMVYSGHPPPHMYYQQGHQQPHYPIHAQMTPDHSGDSHLGPAAEVNGSGLPPSNAEVYHDEYGHPHPVHVAKIEQDATAEPPAKRQKSDDSQVVDESDEDEEIADAPPLPHNMTLSTKPSRPKPSSHTARSDLLGLFSEDLDINVQQRLGAVDDASFDIDMIIDEHGHTALHWAASLARVSVVKQLVELGADIHRGNFNGETPLARATLTANNAEAGTLSELLVHLAPSIQTLDQSYRSVIHHIALVSGIPGRASCARTYMTGILEWVAKEQRTSASLAKPHDGTNGTTGTSPSLSLKALVDVQDLYGDTALNVAARTGSRGLVRLLLDAGADKARGNKLGLRPIDFGVEVEALALTQAETVVANLKSENKKPEKRSRDVQKNISAVFDHINETYNAELTAKQMSLNQTEQNVRLATRSLADKRQQMQRSQAALTELEQIRQKSENIRKALSSTQSHDWTGRAETGDASIAFKKFPPHLEQPTTTNGHSNGTDIALPAPGQEGSVATLRRMREWEKRMRQVLEQRVGALEGEGLDKELKYRRLVSVCTKVPVDKVDGMLDHLATAIKSDGPSIDLSRITGFISRMKTDVAAR